MNAKTVREVQAPYAIDPADDAIGRDTIIIEYHDKPVAVIVPYDEYLSWKIEEKTIAGEIDPEFRKQWRAFQRLKPRLLEEYEGQWVAIVNEQVVAVGATSQVVLTDVLERYGDVPMCIQEALEEPRLYRISGPRIIRMVGRQSSS